MKLAPEPLTGTGFAGFGAVVSAEGAGRSVNQGRARRFDCQAEFEVAAEGGRPALGVFQAEAAELPYRLDRLERHLLGSQAFVPMAGQRLLVVVAKAGGTPEPAGLRAFLSDGRQGVVYHPGTWHHPLIVLDGGGDVLVVERRANAVDCEEWPLPSPVTVTEAP